MPNIPVIEPSADRERQGPARSPRWQTAPRDDAILGLLALAVLLLFGKLLMGHMLYSSDVLRYALPQKAVLRDYWAAGRLPALDPYLLCGTPLLADIVAGALYPANVLLLIGSTLDGFHLFVVAHYLAAAGACYWFLRRGFRLCAWAAACGAAAYALGGYAWSMADHMFFQSLVWIPLHVLGLIEAYRGLEKGRWRGWFLLATVSLTLLVLSGQWQQACDTVVFGGVLSAIAVWRLWQRGLCGHAWKVAALGTAAVLLGFCLAAPQILPTATAAARSYRRAGIDLATAQAWSLPPFRLIELIVPYAFGPKQGYGMLLLPFYEGSFPWSQSLFLGVPLLLGLAAVRPGGRRWLSGWALAVAAAGLLLALGRYLPVYRLAHAFVPTFSMYRHPEKYMLWVHAGLVFAGAGGLHRLLTDAGVRRPERSTRALLVVAAGFAVLVTGSAVVFSGTLPQLLPQLGCRWQLPHLVVWQCAQAAGTCAAALAFLYVCRHDAAAGSHWLGPVALLLTVLHLAVVHHLAPWTIPRTWFREAATAAACIPEPERSQFRVFSEPHTPDRPADAPERPILAARALGRYRALMRNSPALHRIRTVGGFSPVADPAYVAFTDFGRHDPTAVLRLASARYLVVPGDVAQRDLPGGHTRVNRGNADGYSVLKLSAAVPRVRTCSQHVVVTPAMQAGAALALAAQRPNAGAAAAPVVVSRTPAHFDPGSALCATPDLEILRDRPGETRVACTGPTWLVVHDWLHPGWRATTADGQRLEIVRADGGFLAVFVPAGRRTVTLSYRPPGFVAGCTVAALSVALAAALLLWRQHPRTVHAPDASQVD